MTIKDKDGKWLTEEEYEQYADDLFSLGIGGRPSNESIMWLWNKWGKRLGIEEPILEDE